MSVEVKEEDGLAKNPNLEIAQVAFNLRSDRSNEVLKKKLIAFIKASDMSCYYKECCKEFGWKLDQQMLSKMEAKNKEEFVKLDAKIAEEKEYESDEKDALIAKAEYLCQIGNREESLEFFKKAYDKTVALGMRLDIIFNIIRLGLFYMDHDLVTQNIAKAEQLIEDGGDWDRRNRLKVYKGLYCISVRDFKQAAELFLETVSTFTSYELMDYSTFVQYTVYVSVFALDRNQLKNKVIKGSEIQEVLFQKKAVKEYLMSLYDAQYAQFFLSLAQIEQEMKSDRYFSAHYAYYTREMRVLAYTQLLNSYRSLDLKYMADQFGVSIQFIDKELSRFISSGRLHCKIDAVGRIVETNRPDQKNWQYQEVIKRGDLLLNRVQKLSRVINI